MATYTVVVAVDDVRARTNTNDEPLINFFFFYFSSNETNKQQQKQEKGRKEG